MLVAEVLRAAEEQEATTETVFLNDLDPENRAKIRGRPVAIVVPFEETDPETVAPVERFFEKCFDYLEVKLVGKLIAPGVTERGEVAEQQERMQEAADLGRSLA